MGMEAFMGEEQSQDIKMTVAGITLDTTNNMPIIILKSENDDVAIPIWIGLIEASAIATELEGIKLGRPMTHDLLKSVLESLGGKLQRIVVNDLKDNTFYASLFVDMDNTEVEIDSRPSDAIALALRCGAEIFVSKKVIDKSQHIDMSTLKAALQASADGEGDKAKDKWTELLENLKPEDFGKYKM
jgi:bifunctional DNase/RNase